MGRGSNTGSRTASPAPSRQGQGNRITAEQKAQNEAYFARMGEANANRPEGLAPNQGGKYAGFGSQPVEQPQSSGAMPSADEFQKDPMAALTKGFGWFGGVVSKQAKMVNDSYIQPTAKNVSLSLPVLTNESLTEGADCIDRFCSSGSQCGSRGRTGHTVRCEGSCRWVQQVH
jgi:hypothetical protein